MIGIHLAPPPRQRFSFDAKRSPAEAGAKPMHERATEDASKRPTLVRAITDPAQWRVPPSGREKARNATNQANLPRRLCSLRLRYERVRHRPNAERNDSRRLIWMPTSRAQSASTKAHHAHPTKPHPRLELRPAAAGNLFLCQDVPRTDRKISIIEQFRLAAGAVCSHAKEQPVGCSFGASRWP